MGSNQYIGPHRGLPRALEQNELKYRAVQMVLVLFYAEELRRQVIDAAESHARMGKLLAGFPSQDPGPGPGPGQAQTQAAEATEKKRLARAFKALVTDGVITGDECGEIKKLIGFRHAIAHEVHNLTADLSNERWARDSHSLMNKAHYNYQAAEKLEHWRREISDRCFKMHRATSLHMSWMTFQAAERTFKAELKRLDRVIDRQVQQRNAEIETLNAEMDLKGTELVGDFSPRHPYAQYDDGRLTKLGVEVCYRLFDLGKSTLAVAHLTDMSLDAARYRRKLWVRAGGPQRRRVELTSIPHRKFYARYDD